MPVTLAADTTEYGYVAVKKTANGNVIMPYSIYKSGEVTFRTPNTGIFDVIYNAKTFNDISGHWALGYIDFVSSRGLYQGDGSGNFMPNDSMTRAMFAQVLANIEDVDLSVYKTSRFADVGVDKWYSPAIEWAASAGIVAGYGNGNFGPEDKITREQMAVMLVRHAIYKGYELPNGLTTEFNDEADIVSWALEAVKLVQAAGIVVGRPGNIYDPLGIATRAEVSTIFARFIEVYVNYAVDNSIPGTPQVTATASSAGVDAYIDKSALAAIERALMPAKTDNEPENA
jgi:hypothetical protein